ncbi:hypothetical protein CVT25_011187 [Psilocybe cyanescens]|uniref:Carbohydrate kinase PfkB domain-containing protein n=1 Tax=Psilocybe cyanescens TaxID=93625 RepID=A0A409WGW5_PSICY|nr:hypothetical protein CVT25_011187 [Psilocybe cyanescens]
MATTNSCKSFVTLGMFIIDEFSFMDGEGRPTGRTLEPQGSWLQTLLEEEVPMLLSELAFGTCLDNIRGIPSPRLSPSHIGMIVDEGHDFPDRIKQELLNYGKEMWMFRKQPHLATTRAINSYRGEFRGFEYRTPRLRLTPKDFVGTELERPKILHFICSPSRASSIMSEAGLQAGWDPITVYEPIPDRCVPEELPALKNILPFISILSPNAEEALSLLSLPLPASKDVIEKAADEFLEIGIGKQDTGWIVIRSGAMGAYLKSKETQGIWVDAFWNGADANVVVDVTGAGNSFLGGFAAGMILSGDVYQATLHGTVSASFAIEREGLPLLSYTSSAVEMWNGDEPLRRLEVLRQRQKKN